MQLTLEIENETKTQKKPFSVEGWDRKHTGESDTSSITFAEF